MFSQFFSYVSIKFAVMQRCEDFGVLLTSDSTVEIFASLGELTNYRVVRTTPKPLQIRVRLESLIEEFELSAVIREQFKGGTALRVKYIKRIKHSQRN
jgi:hypothetical protein